MWVLEKHWLERMLTLAGKNAEVIMLLIQKCISLLLAYPTCEHNDAAQMCNAAYLTQDWHQQA